MPGGSKNSDKTEKRHHTVKKEKGILQLAKEATKNRFKKIGTTGHNILKWLVWAFVVIIAIHSVITRATGQITYKTETALMAVCTDSTFFKGVFIRDESVVIYSGNGSLSYNVVDGGKLGVGSVIAFVYMDQAQVVINQQLQKLNAELATLKRIQNPGTIETAHPLNLSSLIYENYRNSVNERENGDYDSFFSSREEFLVSLSTYKMITESDMNLTSRISEIEQKISELTAMKQSPIDTKVAERSAYFVSYTDGYEDILKKERINSITADEIDTIEDHKIKNPSIVGKLINGYDWYLTGVIDNTSKNCVIGSTVEIGFQSTSKIFTATIVDLRSDGDDPSRTVVVLYSEQFNYELVRHRCEPAEIINGVIEGLRVPREAIRFRQFEEEVTDENGNTKTELVNHKGVYVAEKNKLSFRKIDVIYEGGDFVISKVQTENGYLTLYDEMAIDGVDANIS